jgi:hypothetical protein
MNEYRCTSANPQCLLTENGCTHYLPHQRVASCDCSVCCQYLGYPIAEYFWQRAYPTNFDLEPKEITNVECKVLTETEIVMLRLTGKI